MSVALQCVIEEQEIRGVVHNFESGPVVGYEWRLRVTYPPTQTTSSRTEWTPWVFGSIQSVDEMLAQWQWFLATHGHLAQSTPPDSTSH